MSISGSVAPIGIFDSGVGGLSVFRAIRQELPQEAIVYLADQAHVPYGLRSLEEVRDFSAGITRFLIAQGCQLIVVACNTASAAALHDLRKSFPDISFVGMEPAVKPAAEYTQTGVVGVLATPATFQGALYSSVVERFASGVVLLQDTCPGLVGQIETGQLDTPETRNILEQALLPMLEQRIDTIVLGCTHYPFVIPLIQEIAGPAVRVIDPAPAVARQAKRVLDQRNIERMGNRPDSTPGLSEAQVQMLTTFKAQNLEAMLPTLLGATWPVEAVYWSSAASPDKSPLSPKI
jgi:glutamate racemase